MTERTPAVGDDVLDTFAGVVAQRPGKITSIDAPPRGLDTGKIEIAWDADDTLQCGADELTWDANRNAWLRS